ncbi:hypothetical protein TRFO_09054 [Tritrichomonas foetus]|uniref:Uncharacterized protein n=1 Tax=Tritrichomonas foetus TaxID=1144522 RepID=A0A1J4JG83_9EUKA|nr:hypothetical protein TRFO_09054 [Tritrichomonas foetus]|eukprot:OHS98184.1 hypothetical protein TRFO_09054 [Tritrichomonas foetus]
MTLFPFQMLKRRLDSLWKTISIIDDNGTVEKTFDLDKYGRHLSKFQKQSPRNIKSMMEEISQPAKVPMPIIKRAIIMPIITANASQISSPEPQILPTYENTSKYMVTNTNFEYDPHLFFEDVYEEANTMEDSQEIVNSTNLNNSVIIEIETKEDLQDFFFEDQPEFIFDSYDKPDQLFDHFD